MFVPHPGTVWQSHLRYAGFVPAQARRIKTNGAMFVNSAGAGQTSGFL